MKTYRIVAESRDQFNIRISLEGKREDVMAYEAILQKSFRDITITDTETGEVMRHIYISDEWFVPERGYWETIGELEGFVALKQCFSLGTK